MAQTVKRYFFFLILGLITFWRGSEAKAERICVTSSVQSACEKAGYKYCTHNNKCYTPGAYVTGCTPY